MAAGRDPDDGVDHPGRARRRGRALDDSLAGGHPVGPRAALGGPVPGRGPAGDGHGVRRHGSRRERRPHRGRAGAGAAAAAARPGHAGRGAGGGAAHQDRAGGRVDPWPLAGGNAVPGRPRAVRRADRAPQPAHGRRGRVGACPRPGSRCRPGDRLRRRERVVAGAGRQRAARGDRPHERGGHAHRGHGAVPAHALGHPDCRRPRRPREGSTRARRRSVLGDRRVARAGNADGPGPDGGRLADRGAPRRLPGGRRAGRGDRRVHPRSRRGRAGDGVVAVERGRSSGGPARTGRVGGAPRRPPGPRSCRLGVGAPRGRVPVSRGRHRLACAPVRRGPRRG